MAYSDVEVIDIGGPGLVKSGGGFTGGAVTGGFGAVAALEGKATAAVLNALTTRKSIETVIRVQAVSAGLFLLHTQQTPDQIRMHLSRPLAAIRAMRTPAAATGQGGAGSLVERLAQLAGRGLALGQCRAG